MRREWLTPAAICALGIMVAVLAIRVEDTRQELDPIKVKASMAVDGVGTVSAMVADRAVQEHVVRLPDDGGLYWTICLVHKDWKQRQADRELVASFDADGRLASLKAQTKFSVVVEGDPLYAAHFAAAGKLPCLYVQTQEGRVLYKESGPQLVPTAVRAERIFEIFDKRPWLRIRPWKRPRPCPEPGPCPGPEPGPDVVPDTDVDVDVVIPDLGPPEEAEQSQEASWALLPGLAAAGAGVLTMLVQWKKRSGF